MNSKKKHVTPTKGVYDFWGGHTLFVGWGRSRCCWNSKKYVSIVKCYYSSIAPMHSSLGLQFMWGPCGSEWFGPPKRREFQLKTASAVFQTDGKTSTPAFLWMKCGAYQTDETVLRTINWLISVESKYRGHYLTQPNNALLQGLHRLIPTKWPI